MKEARTHSDVCFEGPQPLRTYRGKNHTLALAGYSAKLKSSQGSYGGALRRMSTVTFSMCCVALLVHATRRTHERCLHISLCSTDSARTNSVTSNLWSASILGDMDWNSLPQLNMCETTFASCCHPGLSEVLFYAAETRVKIARLLIEFCFRKNIHIRSPPEAQRRPLVSAQVASENVSMQRRFLGSAP